MAGKQLLMTEKQLLMTKKQLLMAEKVITFGYFDNKRQDASAAFFPDKLTFLAMYFVR